MSDHLNHHIWREDFEKALSNIVGWMPPGEAIGIFLAKYGQTAKPAELRAALEEVAIEMRGEAWRAGDMSRTPSERAVDGFMGDDGA